jgi:hypothetical protein
MDNQLRNLLLDNYEKSLPSKRDTEDFINNFRQYRTKKKAQEKTHYSIALIVLLIVTALGSIAIKETTNKLDIQTASGKSSEQIINK